MNDNNSKSLSEDVSAINQELLKCIEEINVALRSKLDATERHLKFCIDLFSTMEQFRGKQVEEWIITNGPRVSAIADTETKRALKVVEALRFYASNFRSDIYVGPTTELLNDFGAKASAALKEWDGEK